MPFQVWVAPLWFYSMLLRLVYCSVGGGNNAISSMGCSTLVLQHAVETSVLFRWGGGGGGGGE